MASFMVYEICANIEMSKVSIFFAPNALKNNGASPPITVRTDLPFGLICCNISLIGSFVIGKAWERGLHSVVFCKGWLWKILM